MGNGPDARPCRRRRLACSSSSSISAASSSALAARLSEASRVDPLTGLLNRRAFEEMLNFELDRSRRTGARSSVIVGEMDGMGRLNSERGHAAGDAALKQVGADMSKWKRRIDSAGRIGGEKFGVLLPETDEHGAFLVAERLRRASRRTFAQGSLPLTISFGVASYPDHGEEFGVLMGAATARGRRRRRARPRPLGHLLRRRRAHARRAARARGGEPRLSSMIGLAEELDVRDTGTHRPLPHRRPLRGADGEASSGFDARSRRARAPRGARARHRQDRACRTA